jgi:hypothetical protein
MKHVAIHPITKGYFVLEFESFRDQLEVVKKGLFPLENAWFNFAFSRAFLLSLSVAEDILSLVAFIAYWRPFQDHIEG